MKYTNIPAAQAVVYHCKTKGIDNIVISPGSRNAPLTIGFTEDTYFRCFSIVDERSAAFFALGIAQHTRNPVALVCTSGSALLNYYPAIAEAFYSDIPLVVITADRPAHKIDIGDGQTIRQEHVFKNHILFSANLSQDVDPTGVEVRSKVATAGKNQLEVQKGNDALLNLALNCAFENRGPVHINIPMEEPLYNTVDQISIQPEVIPYTIDKGEGFRDPGSLAKQWDSAPKKLVLVGVNMPGTVDPEVLAMLAADNSVLVFTETTSNVHHDGFFPSIDSIIAPIENSDLRHTLFGDLRPNILLTFGGMVVSKKVKAFLRRHTPEQHWHIDLKRANDTFFCLTRHFRMEINAFLRPLLKQSNPTASRYRPDWERVKVLYEQNRKKYLAESPFSDFVTFAYVIESIPKGYQVQLANSSTVRYTQLFDMDSSLKVFCNRGTSGIDGSTSTAIGASLYEASPTVLLTGDLSFLYDSNALWNGYLRSDFRIILINNGGGGIFRILPGKEETENFKNFFETVQHLNMKKLCDFYGLEHLRVSDRKSLTDALSGFYLPGDTPMVLEVVTPRLINDKILLGYFDFIS